MNNSCCRLALIISQIILTMILFMMQDNSVRVCIYSISIYFSVTQLIGDSNIIVDKQWQAFICESGIN